MAFKVVVQKSEVGDFALLNQRLSNIAVSSAPGELLIVLPLPGKLIDVLKVLTDQKIQYQLLSEHESANG